jgi:hypothetical protein
MAESFNSRIMVSLSWRLPRGDSSISDVVINSWGWLHRQRMIAYSAITWRQRGWWWFSRRW